MARGYRRAWGPGIPQASHGFTCPFCGTRTSVQQTIPPNGQWNGILRRVRRCRKAHTIQTIEMLDPAQIHRLAALLTVGTPAQEERK